HLRIEFEQAIEPAKKTEQLLGGVVLGAPFHPFGVRAIVEARLLEIATKLVFERALFGVPHSESAHLGFDLFEHLQASSRFATSRRRRTHHATPIERTASIQRMPRPSSVCEIGSAPKP